MSLSRGSSSSSIELSKEDQDFMDKYDRFIHDDEERSGRASKKISDYVHRLSIDWRGKKRLEQVRDESLAYLKEQRESEYYQSIKAKVVAGEKVLPGEYYYFVLTTENLQLVDVEMLEGAERFFNFQNCEENLSVVKAALHYQHAQTGEEKWHWQQELADTIRFYCPNEVRPLFLNLAGVDISGADLMDTPKEDRGRRTGPHLNLADLSGAKLDGCNMYAFHINNSDLTGASLSDVYGDRNGERWGPRIYTSLARNACFDGIEFDTGSCEETDFTGASFKKAKFRGMFLGESIFDDANFEGATLEYLRDTRDASFKNTNFLNAKLKRVGFSDNDFTGARFINPEHMNNLSDLNEELNRIAGALLPELDGSNWWGKNEIQAIQNLIAKDVARCVDEKFVESSSQQEFYDAAAQHRLFHHHADMSTWLTCGAKSIYNSTVGTMFGGFGKYYSDDAATKYLEELRDQVDTNARHNI